VGVREGAAVPVGEAVALAVGDAVTADVVAAEAVGVHATVDETVAGSRNCGAAIVSFGLDEMGGRAGVVQPHAKARTSSPPIIRMLIYPDTLWASTSPTDLLRSPAVAARIAQGIPSVKACLPVP
jgi:hypothetical protein